MAELVTLQHDCRGIDWESVRELYRISEFDNGRRSDELECAFENSYTVCFALSYGGNIVGTARAISDTISCASIFDVCVHPDFRRCGIGTKLMKAIMRDLGSQYILLASTAPEFYVKCGFRPEDRAMVR